MEEPLKRAVIYMGPQVQPLVPGLYVPLGVLVGEIFLFMLIFKLFLFYAIALLPLHLIPMVYTKTNPNWVKYLRADFKYRLGASNKNLFGKGVITYSPLSLRKP